MSNINLKLHTSFINIAVTANTAILTTRDAEGNVTSAVPVMNHRPYEDDRKALVRALYTQSYNSELVMDAADRELYRELTLKLAKDVGDAADAFYVGEYAEVRENNKGIIGWIDIARKDDKVVSIGVGMELGTDAWSHHYDVSNGPVPFNAPLYTNPEFLNMIGKIVEYTTVNNLI